MAELTPHDSARAEDNRWTLKMRPTSIIVQISGKEELHHEQRFGDRSIRLDGMAGKEHSVHRSERRSLHRGSRMWRSQDIWYVAEHDLGHHIQRL